MKRLGERAAVVAAIALSFAVRHFLRVGHPNIVPRPGLDANPDGFGIGLGAQRRPFFA